MPPLLIRKFAKQIPIPLVDIINFSVKYGQWSKIYKKESVTPVPKTYPPKSPNDLRNISGLLTFNKIMEKMIGELLVSDIMENLDPAQYANQQGVSLQHYLIKMINVILTDTDNSKKGEAKAVKASLIDWKKAFPRQCLKLGVEAFIKCCLRN